MMDGTQHLRATDEHRQSEEAVGYLARSVDMHALLPLVLCAPTTVIIFSFHNLNLIRGYDFYSSCDLG